jgi:hypothetical protein
VEYVHPHPPEALIEGHKHEAASPEHVERRLELGAVLLLAFATLATAWCGFQAASWSGHLSEHFARQSGTHVESAQAAMRAGDLRIDDQQYFDGWLDARSTGNTKLAAIYRRRFRAEFVPAFEAWMAQKPFSGHVEIPGPFYMPQYRSAELERSEKLDAIAEEQFAEGTRAKTNADRYILATVFMAAVLFFAGISLRLDWRRLQIAVLGMACALLVGGVAYVISLPMA